jgi:putative hemolysin
MDPDHLYRLIGFLLLLGLSAIFAASETALFSLTRIQSERLRQEKSRSAGLILSLLRNPPRLLVTILVANEIINISAETLAVSLAIDRWGMWGRYLSVVVLTPLMVILIDVAPKTIALTFPEWTATTFVRPVYLAARLLFPLRWLVTKLAEGISDLLGAGDRPTAKEARTDELRALVHVGEREGALDPSERKLIHRVFAFGNRTVSDVMTPRVEIVSYPVDLNPRALLEEIRHHRLSRVPLYKGDKDNIVGILYAKDLIGFHLLGAKHNEWNIEGILRKPHFVPLQMKLDLLLPEFRREKVHIALVVDEYGGIAGLVTMEDLLEELFGEIRDEFDVKEEHVQEVAPEKFEVSGAMPWEEFKEWGKISAEDENKGTIGGWLIEEMGRIPKEGEGIRLDGWQISVAKVQGGKIEKLKVERAKEPAL